MRKQRNTRDKCHFLNRGGSRNGVNQKKEEIQNNRIEIREYRKRDKVEAARHLRALDSCKRMGGWEENALGWRRNINIFEAQSGSWSGNRKSHSSRASLELNMAALCGISVPHREDTGGGGVGGEDTVENT